MAFSLAQNAIAMLIDLAERGEIDPWDVQVIDVIDRFLSQLRPVPVSTETGKSAYEVNLSESGQAFLYASMLVLLKADSLARLESDEDEEAELEEAELLDAPDLNAPMLPLRLEQQLRRRATARPPQNRRVTLRELIGQLEIMAASMVEQPLRAKVRRPRPQARRHAARAIAQLAHQENLSEIAAALEQFLTTYWPQISQGEEWIDFELLLDCWVNPHAHQLPGSIRPEGIEESHSGQGDRVVVFWALLFLSAQSKVELAQEEFYQDLRIRSLSPEDVLADRGETPPMKVATPLE
jgi:segregation and condensation protein A